MKHTFYLFIFLLSTHTSFAQLNQVAQIDIAKDAKFNESISVLPLDKNGMLLTLQKEGFFNRNVASWVFYRYDTNLKERWQTTLNLEADFKSVMSYQNK